MEKIIDEIIRYAIEHKMKENSTHIAYMSDIRPKTSVMDFSIENVRKSFIEEYALRTDMPKIFGLKVFECGEYDIMYNASKDPHYENFAVHVLFGFGA